MAMELGTPVQYPALRGQGLVGVRHPSRLCFAHRQAVTVFKQRTRAKEDPGLLEPDRSHALKGSVRELQLVNLLTSGSLIHIIIITYSLLLLLLLFLL